MCVTAHMCVYDNQPEILTGGDSEGETTEVSKPVQSLEATNDATLCECIKSEIGM